MGLPLRSLHGEYHEAIPKALYKLPGVQSLVGPVTTPLQHAMALWPGFEDGNALGSKGSFTKPSSTNPHPRARTLYVRRLVSDPVKRQHDYEYVRDFLAAREDKVDEYITVNTFRGARSNANLLSLTSFFIDLDLAIGNDETNRGQFQRYGMDFMRQLQDGLDVLSAEGIPGPNLVTHTGKGTHLYWLFDRPVPAKALSRWRVAMNILVEKLAAVGADKNACDPARVLRLVGSLNSTVVTESNGVRKPWKVTAQVLNPLRYDFDFLCDQILPLTREEWQAKKQARAAQIREFVPHQIRRGKTRSKPAAGRTYADTAARRLADLELLAKARFPNGVEEGSRDLYLFHATVNLAWICRQETLQSEVLRWKDRFVSSWSDHDALLSMKTAMAKAYEAYAMAERPTVFDDPRYVYSAKKVWNTFKDDIELAGVRDQLLGIQPDGELAARAKAKRRAARDDHYTGHGVREANIAKALEAHDLAGAGATTREIAASLGVSHKTVAAWLHIDPTALKPRKPILAPVSYPQPAISAPLLPKGLLNRGGALRASEFLSLKGAGRLLEVRAPDGPVVGESSVAFGVPQASLPLESKDLEMGFKPFEGSAPKLVVVSSPRKTYRDKYQPELLAWLRELDVCKALDLLDLHYRIDAGFVPRKTASSYRLHVSRDDGGVHELVCTGPKFFDKSPVNPIKGAGAIDLAMSLLGLRFDEAMQRLLASPNLPVGLRN